MTTTEAPRVLVVPAVLVAALSGALVAVQGRFNGDLSSAGAGALVSTWLSYVGTLVTTAIVLVVQGRAARTARTLVHDARWWWYAVGLCGVPIVIMFAIGIPIVGVAIASVCAVAGQTVSGLALDSRGVGLPAALRLTRRRLVAALVAITGLVVAVGAVPTTNLAQAVALGVAIFVAGMLLSGQQAGNGRVTQLSGNPVLPALTSSAGGTAAVTLLLGIAAATGHLDGVHLPGEWWLYLGGPLGAAITVCAAWAIRHLGTFALSLGVVVGQMVTAVLVDLATDVATSWATFLAVVLVTGATLLVVLPSRHRVVAAS
ncbi:DMT family transporter [Cellulomonas composti]|uniref:Membrane protein n=1 Tax=Cellulomonas composti TaxID=266130 RepID=A0A511JA64_9CELL|nr:DMT family transporter [Cellulomonas composti]GEL94659.1 membrane protein [Cellulomonas composti]